MSYTPDGRTEEVARLIFGEYSRFEVTTSNYIFGCAPEDWAPKIQEAEALKQQGQYLAAAEILISLMVDFRTLSGCARDLPRAGSLIN